MPAKHIDDVTWSKVQKETMKVIRTTDTVFKETEILRELISIGLERATEEDWERMALKKRTK